MDSEIRSVLTFLSCILCVCLFQTTNSVSVQHAAALQRNIRATSIKGSELSVVRNLFLASSTSQFELRPASQELEDSEATCRRLVVKLLEARKTHDFNSYIALWSENSPFYAQEKALKSKIESENFAFSNPRFSHFSIEGKSASIRLAFDSRTERDNAVRLFFYNFSFLNEAGLWKIWKQSDAQSDLASAINQTETQAQVDLLLHKEAEMVNVHLVEELDKKGAALFFVDPNRARKSFERAYEVAVLLDKRLSNASSKNAIGSALHNLANAERAQANYGKVLEYENRVLALATTPKLKTDALINIGITHALQNDYNLAFRFFINGLHSAKTIRDEADRNSRIGLIYDSLGNLRGLQQRFDEALEYYRLTLKYRNSLADRAQTFDNIGIVYHRKADFPNAVVQYQKSLGLLNEIKVKEGKDLVLIRATVLTNLASAVLNQGNIPAAIEYAKETGLLATQLNIPELQWRAYLIEAKARRTQHDIPATRALLEESIKVIEGMRGRAGGGIEGRQRFLEDKLEPYNVIIDLLMAEGRSAEAFEYCERSKANSLLEVLSSGTLFLQRVMSEDEQRQEQRFRLELANLNSNILRMQLETDRSSELSALLQRRQAATEKYDEFLDEIYGKYFRVRSHRGKILTIKLEETAELLPNAQTAILEFSVTESATYLYVIRRTVAGVDVSTHKIEVTRRALTSQVEKLRTAIDRKQLNYQQKARQLFALLLGEASAELSREKTVIVVPDGPLWELPFQALYTTSGRPWLEDHAIFEAPSLTALREMRAQRQTTRSASQPTLLALINPRITKDLERRIQKTRLDTRLTPLPNQDAQIESLRKLYGGPPSSVILHDSSASEEEFRNQARRFQILYMFTHGVLINENPLHSYLVLSSSGETSDESDGLLEAEELMTMQLKADLVILAGCETARGHIGRGEGMIGMGWALFIAGVPTVVVSQWRVPATSTGELMTEFHRLLPKRDSARTSITIAQALRDASLKTRSKHGQDHPVYWAGFVIVGDGQ